jgi:peptidoglycan/xylan/chitin deacetylase (PgdA/CDA1 family)
LANALLEETLQGTSLSEIVSRLEQDVPLPPYSAAVTFDDGFANNFTVAFPCLKVLGIPASVFVTTGLIGTRGRMLWTEKISYCCMHTQESALSLKIGGDRLVLDLSTPQNRRQAASQLLGILKQSCKQVREDCLEQLSALPDFQTLDGTRDEDRYRFLTWSEVGRLAEGNIDIGSHTVHHEILSTLSPEEAWEEISRSKREIEDQLGRECRLFSYPNGSSHDFTARDKASLREAGYRAAVSLIKTLNPARPDLMALGRLNINRQHNAFIFIATITGFLPFLRDVVNTLKQHLPLGQS